MAVLRSRVPPIPSVRLPALVPRLLSLRLLADERRRGILLLLAATVFFSCSDATSKYVTRTLPVIEVAWVRYAVFVLVTLAVALRGGGVELLRTRRPVQQVLRGIAIIASALFFLIGLPLLPLADAAAINFISPLLITALAVPILGERVGLDRWVALLVGLGGAVLAAQPGSASFQPAAAFPALSALAWAFAMVLTRRFAATERPQTTLVWTACCGLAVLSLMLPFVARWPTPLEFALCLQIGVLATAGQSLVVLAYRLGPASLLAPFSYLQLIWSTTLGYVVFGTRPATATVVGAMVIAGCGLYTIGRTRTRT